MRDGRLPYGKHPGSQKGQRRLRFRQWGLAAGQDKFDQGIRRKYLSQQSWRLDGQFRKEPLPSQSERLRHEPRLLQGMSDAMTLTLHEISQDCSASLALSPG
jgi:hypothetical protein